MQALHPVEEPTSFTLPFTSIRMKISWSSHLGITEYKDLMIRTTLFSIRTEFCANLERTPLRRTYSFDKIGIHCCIFEVFDKITVQFLMEEYLVHYYPAYLANEKSYSQLEVHVERDLLYWISVDTCIGFFLKSLVDGCHRMGCWYDQRYFWISL